MDSIDKYKGLMRDLSIDEYHNSPGISRSGLMKFMRSPLHYWHEYVRDGREKAAPTDAMIFGNALHTLVLEPNDFDARYKVIPKIDRRTKAGKEAYEKHIVDASNMVILTEDEMLRLESMKCSIFEHPYASKLLKNIEVEQSIYWTDPETQILCKCRPDILSAHYVADLKTTMDASSRAFKYDLVKYGYALQAAMITEGLKHTTGEIMDEFIFIPIEKDEPYALGVYSLDKATLAQGVLDFHEALRKLRVCIDKNEWNSYSVEVVG